MLIISTFICCIMFIEMVNPVQNLHLDNIVAVAAVDVDLVFHVTEEAFLRSVIPAVSTPRHRLAKSVILQEHNESCACVLASLV